MIADDKAQFNSLRAKVARMIQEALEMDCCHKSYEGTWELKTSYPNYFEDDTATQPPDWYCVTLHCYVLGPSRHYDWTGRTFSEALNKAEREIDGWCNDG